MNKERAFLIIDNTMPPENKYLSKVVEYLNTRGLSYEIASSPEEISEISSRSNIIGAISTGSDYRVSDVENLEASNFALESLDCPILGICYGFQAMADFYGANISGEEEQRGEFSPTWIDKSFWMFEGLEIEEPYFCFHDYPSNLPSGFKKICEIDGKIAGIADDGRKRYGILFHPEEKKSTYGILDRFAERCLSENKPMAYMSKYENFAHKNNMKMKHLKLYEEFEKRISIFDQDIKSLLPEEIRIENSYGRYMLKKKDIMLNGDLIQIVYHHNTAEEKNDVTADGEPDYLCIDIHTMKKNAGHQANGDSLRLNVDITYGDAMVSEFTIEAPNKVKPHHYTGIGSMHDPETTFSFDDDSLQDLVEFFNRFSDSYKLSIKDFKFLDSDPNSYNPKY